MMQTRSRAIRIKKWLSKPVIPVIWGDRANYIAAVGAATVFIQGGDINQLPAILAPFESGPLEAVTVLVHLDLLAGLNADHAGVQYLASFPRIDGIITTRYPLLRLARDLNMLAIVRLFLQDSRSLERGLKVIAANKPDLVEVLPGIASIEIADALNNLTMPWIAGGMIRHTHTVQQIMDKGGSAISTSSAELWPMNRNPIVPKHLHRRHKP